MSTEHTADKEKKTIPVGIDGVFYSGCKAVLKEATNKPTNNWVSMSLHLTTISSSLLFDYTYRDYLLAVNHQIDGTPTDLAPVLIILTNLYSVHTSSGSGSAFKMQSFYNPAKHMYSGSRGSILLV